MTPSEKRFLTILGGVTLVAAGGLVYWGLRSGSRYNDAYDRYQQASGTVQRLERMKPYPSSKNLNAKKKALDEYKQSLAALQDVFASYRPAKLENVESADFADRLIKVAEKTKKALEDAETEMPEGFALGFKKYTSSPAPGEATGLLGYQLDAIAELFDSVAASGVAKVENFMRVELPEEKGATYTPAENEIARPMPLELTLYGAEPDIRAFVNAMVGSKKHYYLVRTMEVKNEKQTAPTAEEAKFVEPAAEEGSDPFSGGGDFVIPEDEGASSPFGGGGEAETPAAPAPGDAAKPEPAAEEKATEKAPEPAAETPKPAENEGERILKQLVGNEKLHVFLRLDVMLFQDKTEKTEQQR
jgi:hypothetical protein